jgi:hypothetical protein
MLRLPSLGEMDRTLAAKVYLATGSTDMRKGFDSLAALVRDRLSHDPLSGSLFLFVGRGRDRLKILYWDSDGFAVSPTQDPRDCDSEGLLSLVSPLWEGGAHLLQP